MQEAPKQRLRSIVDEPTTFRPLMRLAIPVFASQILDLMVGLTDTYLAGQYLKGSQFLAAMNLTNYVLWFIISIFTIVAIGTTALVARHVGAGDHAEARRISNVSLWLGTVMCLIPVALVFLLGDYIALKLGLSAEAAPLAQQYWKIYLLAMPAVMLESVGGAALRAAGDTVTPMISMIIVNIVDMVTSYCLVRGVGPFPKMGWEGLAVGNVCGYAVGMILMLVALHWGPAGLKIKFSEMFHTEGRIRRILRIGIPGGIDILAMIVCHLVFVRIVNLLGDISAGAHGVAIRIEAISYQPAYAFQVAASTMVGQFLGAKLPERAAHSVWVACKIGVAFAIFSGSFLYFGSDWLARQFVSAEQTDLAAQAGMALRTISVAQPALVILMIVIGALRGAGDTKWPLIVTFVGFLVVRIPLAILLTHAIDFLPITVSSLPWQNLGLWGAWLAMITDLFIRAALVVYRFSQGKWRHVEV